MQKEIAPFGTWRSPVTAATISTGDTRIRNLQVTGETISWLEVRPAESGRGVVVAWTAEHGRRDITPSTSNVATRVHEYGGGEYRYHAIGVVYSEKRDDSVWLIEGTQPPRQIVAVSGCRYADFAFDPKRRCIYAVREDHRDRSPVDPRNEIVAIDIDAIEPTTNAGRAIFSKSDFVSSPRPSPDGTHVAWIAWDHPNMPWDHTRLYLADAAAPDRPRLIAGETPEAIEQIAWSDDGDLYYTSDRTGWANLYRFAAGTVERVYEASLEFSHPAWQFRAISIAPVGHGRVLCAYAQDGRRTAALLESGRRTDLAIGQVQDAPQPSGTGLAWIAEPAEGPATVQRSTDVLGDAVSTVYTAGAALPTGADVSIGRAVTFLVGRDAVTHAFFYPPANARFAGPADARPPLIVTSHGGPTSMRTNAFTPSIQFWTTRGFAVADVNYRGSTGYGTTYRDRLRGQWGIVDVEDCIAVAQGLIDSGAVDADRIAIRGGSSSGFTTLAALAASRLFRAGASYYPVTDLSVFTGETHKFESRYIEGLIGPPDAVELYRSRSPVTNAASITAPVAIFQGLDDKVVPPNQSERMVAALRANGTPVEYHAYAGEGHGFLKAETLEHSLGAELAFYRRALAIDIVD